MKDIKKIVSHRFRNETIKSVTIARQVISQSQVITNFSLSSTKHIIIIVILKLNYQELIKHKKVNDI